jgi:outer membrane beta-barrel protein
MTEGTFPMRAVRFALVAAALAATPALAQELVEKTVVKNRLYLTGGRPEAGLDVGFTLLSRLTDHINLNAHFAYNMSDTFAVELRGGYALSRHTGLADQIQDHFASNTAITKANDLADLWEMTANGALGARWAPIYGKISLMSELPIHFQAYLWLGGGGGLFQRTSVVICSQGSVSGTAVTNCNAFLTEQKAGPFLSAAAGARFFLTPRHSIKLEVRDYSWPDSYLENVDRVKAAQGQQSGESSRNAGVTNLAIFDVGYSLVF